SGVGPGGQPVDIPGRKAGVADGGQARIEREVEWIPPEAATDGRAPDSRYDRVALGHHRVGWNIGTYTSSRGSKETSTSIPANPPVRSPAPEVGHATPTRLPPQPHAGDDVGRVVPGDPRALHDREPIDESAPRHRRDFHGPRRAVRADR